MLPKPLYEALPYVYFLIGSALWIASTNLLEIFAGILLYFAGAQQWVLRSNYRRSDRFEANLLSAHQQHHQQQQSDQRGHYPRWLYEMLPFVYIGLGYQLANLMHNPHWLQQWSLDRAFTITAILCLVCAGLLILTLRGVHRFSAQTNDQQRPHY